MQTNRHFLDKPLSPAQFGLLRIIAEKEIWTSSELAQAMGVTMSAITGLVDKLERLDFIIRARDALDRRVIHISLTVKGRDFLTSADEQRRLTVHSLFADLSTDDLKNLTQIFDKLAVTNIPYTHMEKD